MTRVVRSNVVVSPLLVVWVCVRLVVAGDVTVTVGLVVMSLIMVSYVCVVGAEVVG